MCSKKHTNPFHLPSVFHSEISLSIFAGRKRARFRQIWTQQANRLVENLSLSEGMRAFPQQAPCREHSSKLANGEFSFPLVDLVASTYGNTSKIDLKIDKLMSLPSIEKEDCGTESEIPNLIIFQYVDSLFDLSAKAHGLSVSARKRKDGALKPQSFSF